MHTNRDFKEWCDLLGHAQAVSIISLKKKGTVAALSISSFLFSVNFAKE